MKLILCGDIVPTAATVPAFDASDLNALMGDALDVLRSGDFTVGNLECALTNGEERIRKCGPHLKGRSLASAIKITWHGKTDEGYDVPAVMVVGKRKPTLPVEGNEQRIQRYLQRFEAAVEQYRGQPFPI